MKFSHAQRPSRLAGTWFSGDPEELTKEIDAYIHNNVLSEDEFKGDVFGLIAPHAGHIYSGRTAGYAYRLVSGKQVDVVAVLSPFHQFHRADVITTVYDNYTTPLGTVPVSTDLLSQLNERIHMEQIEQDPEHSLEIQLPFLQRALHSPFSLLPLMVRTRDSEKLKTIASTLMELLADSSFLIIASTDLSHFHSLEEAQQLDAEMLRRIKAMDADAVLSAESDGVASACGASSVALLLYAAKLQNTTRAYILNYSTSADATGDSSSVVGYGSAAILIS